jgi:hypothetical protein
MNTRITHFSLVIDFLDIAFDSDSISDILKKEVDDVLRLNSIELPSKWCLVFRATYSNAKGILISKNKLGTYPSDKMKEVKIVIPVPLKEIVEWGVEEHQHVYGIDHYDKLMNNFCELEVDYSQYSNRQDYIIACLRSGIKKLLKKASQ